MNDTNSIFIKYCLFDWIKIPEERFSLAHLFLVVMWWSFGRKNGEIERRTVAVSILRSWLKYKKSVKKCKLLLLTTLWRNYPHVFIFLLDKKNNFILLTLLEKDVRENYIYPSFFIFPLVWILTKIDAGGYYIKKVWILVGDLCMCNI